MSGGSQVAKTPKSRLEELESEMAVSFANGRRSHFEIGRCLDEILYARLYLVESTSFDAYCSERLGISGDVGRNSANAYRVAKNLKQAEEEMPALYWNVLDGLGVGHANALAKLSPADQATAWGEARQKSDSPTVSEVEAVAEKYRHADVSRMTADEEAEYNASVEAETLEAYRRKKVAEAAAWISKRLRSVVRRAQGEFVAESFESFVADLNRTIEKNKIIFSS